MGSGHGTWFNLIRTTEKELFYRRKMEKEKKQLTYLSARSGDLDQLCLLISSFQDKVPFGGDDNDEFLLKTVCQTSIATMGRMKISQFLVEQGWTPISTSSEKGNSRVVDKYMTKHKIEIATASFVCFMFRGRNMYVVSLSDTWKLLENPDRKAKSLYEDGKKNKWSAKTETTSNKAEVNESSISGGRYPTNLPNYVHLTLILT